MLYNAISFVLQTIRAVNRCLEDLDQNLSMQCRSGHLIRNGLSAGDSCVLESHCGQQPFSLPPTLTVNQLRKQLEQVTSHLEQILVLIHK